MATVNMSIRMDKELKAQAEAMFSDMGLNMTTAMNIFLRQAVREQRIPFDITLRVPNSETIEAIKEMDDMINGKIPAKRYSSTKELFEDLEA